MFSFPLYRAYAEDSFSVKQDPKTEPSEKEKHEEEESSGSEDRKAVASGDEEAQPEGKKKKRSGFRDRKVPNLGVFHLHLLHCSGKKEKSCRTYYSSCGMLWYVNSLALALYLSLFSKRP